MRLPHDRAVIAVFTELNLFSLAGELSLRRSIRQRRPHIRHFRRDIDLRDDPVMSERGDDGASEMLHVIGTGTFLGRYERFPRCSGACAVGSTEGARPYRLCGRK